MDWIRRNWPDLLIGLALLAVIAGIIATLLNGGSFFPGRSSPAASTSPPAATDTAQAGTGPNEAVDPAATSSTVDAATNSTANSSGGVTPTDTAAPTPQGDITVPSIETAPIAGADTSATGTADANTTAANGADVPVISSSGSAANPATSTDTTATAPATNAVTTAPATTSPTTATTSNIAGAESTYRILVGSFGDADNAQRRAQTFVDANFPTFTATQGDLTLVLVGPYDNQADADSAFSRVQSEGLETAPLLFTPTGSDTATTATTTTTTGTTTTDATTTDATTTATDTTSGTTTQTSDSSTTSSESYLQTGAYATSESAQPQRERLEGLGFNVSEVTEGSFVKLLVGPFSGDELAGAESRLSTQGIDYFVRSN